jgi:hypothetical protein
MTAACALAALADLRAEGECCRRLWVAVIDRILADAARTDQDGVAARAWLLRPDPVVVEFAGLDVEVTAPRLARIAQHGVVA